MDNNGTKYVTYRAFLTTLISTIFGALGVTAGVQGWVWTQHLDQPHRGAVSGESFDRFTNGVVTHMGENTKRLRRIESILMKQREKPDINNQRVE